MKLKEKPLDIDKFLGKARNQIHRVGVELEGGWVKLPPGVSLTHDGSVSIKQPEDPTFERKYRQWQETANRANQEGRLNTVPPPTHRIKLHVGELPSTPMEVEKVAAWMKEFYPDKVNETCGLHVHVSFKSVLQYQRLMTPSYPATIVEYFTQWARAEGLSDKHPLWERLTGNNRFCKHEFHAQEQVVSRKDHNQTRPGHRYTVINYCYSVYGGTLECRLLPMMDTSDQGIRAVQHVLAITNAFLMAYREREEKAKAKVESMDIVREHVQDTIYPERRESRRVY